MHLMQLSPFSIVWPKAPLIKSPNAVQKRENLNSLKALGSQPSNSLNLEAIFAAGYSISTTIVSLGFYKTKHTYANVLLQIPLNTFLTSSNEENMISLHSRTQFC